MSLDAPLRPPPGQLTSVMRAARLPSELPRALRVALIENGHVVDERTFAEPERITLGPSERSTFLVVSPAIGRGLTLFVPATGGYSLHLPPGATGKIATGGRAVDLAHLDGATLHLTGDARGRLCIGDATVLFSLESLPPAVARAVLPISVRRGGEIDWTLALVAAMSFLFHFGALGSLYSDWADPPVDEGIAIASLVESVRDLPTPPEVETNEAPESKSSPETKADASVAPVKGKSERRAHDRSDAADNAARTARSAAERSAAADSALSSELASLDIQMHGALGAPGASTDRVLRDGEVPFDRLNDAAEREGRVGAGGLATLGHGGSVGRGRRSLEDLGDRGTGDAPATAGTSRRGDGPKAGATSAPLPPTGITEVPGAEGVIAGLTAGYRRCYQNGLDREDPTMRGRVGVTIRIGPNGEVLSASPSAGGNLSASVIGCIQKKTMGGQFSPPKSGGTVTLFVPVMLEHQ